MQSELNEGNRSYYFQISRLRKGAQVTVRIRMLVIKTKRHIDKHSTDASQHTYTDLNSAVTVYT